MNIICKELKKNIKNKVEDQPVGAIPISLLTITYTTPKNEINNPKNPSANMILSGKFEKLNKASSASENKSE